MDVVLFDLLVKFIDKTTSWQAHVLVDLWAQLIENHYPALIDGQNHDQLVLMFREQARSQCRVV